MEKDEFNPKEMSGKEKIESSRDMRETLQRNILFAEDRAAQASDEFTRLEVQIATILFAFLSIFWNSFSKSLTSFSDGQILSLKVFFAVILLCLITSLIMGLIHLKRSEKFWDGMILQRIRRYDEWTKAARKQVTFEEADAFHEGAVMGKGGHMITAPQWTWILQSVFLGFAVLLILILSLVLLFNTHSLVV